MIEKTIGQILNETVNLFPKNKALIYVERNLRYTYKEFKEKCDQIAKGLMALGIKRGDNIWTLSKEEFELPLWLIKRYNTDVDFYKLIPSQELLIPVVEKVI